MKKLLSFVAVATMFVACGSYIPKVNDAPEVVAKKCLNTYVKGEIEQFAKCFQFESEDEKQELIKEMAGKSNNIKKMGGIKSIEVSMLEQIDNLAEVKVVTTLKNGESFVNKLGLMKIKNIWYFRR